MNTELDAGLALGYKSGPQIARRLTEGWAAANLYCPRCGYAHLIEEPNNRPVDDLKCPHCSALYEIKSKQSDFGGKVMGGAWNTMIDRILSDTNPDFLFLSYSLPEMRVCSLFIVPKFFFVPDIIEKRKPLAMTARRAGWTGCNILLGNVPIQGKIGIIKDGNVLDKSTVMNEFAVAVKLEVKEIESRGWLLDILNCVNKTEDNEFTLDQMYGFENILAAHHPDNNNIRAKIRQQLQVLRDRGLIAFTGRGRYRKTSGITDGLKARPQDES